MDPGWGIASDSQRVDGGALILQPPVNLAKYMLYQGGVFGDADIRVTVSVSKAEEYVTQGVMFWGTDLSDFYICVIESDGTFGAQPSREWQMGGCRAVENQ